VKTVDVYRCVCLIQTYSYFEMQCMVYASHDSSLPGAMFEVSGDLALRQKWPLGNHGIDTRYNVRMLLVMLFIAHQHTRFSEYEQYSFSVYVCLSVHPMLVALHLVEQTESIIM